MTTNPYAVSGAVLEAAAAGRTVVGFEALGSVLVDLGRTTAVPAGAAIRSSGVTAATAASNAGVLAGSIGFVKAAAIVVSFVGASVAVVLSMSGPRGGAAEVRPQQPAAELPPAAERVVDTGSSVEPRDGEDASIASVPTTVAGTREGPLDRIDSASAGTDSSPPVVPRVPEVASVTTVPATPTTSGAPQPATTSVTTTTVTTTVTTTTVSDDDDDDDEDDGDGDHDGRGDHGGRGDQGAEGRTNGNGDGGVNANGVGPRAPWRSATD